MTTIRQILCATDFSPASEPAWEEARLLGRVLNAEILLLHVVAPVALPAEGYFPPRVYQELADTIHREAHAGVDGLLERVTDPLLKVRTRVEEGSAAQRILEVAREEAVDLIVMGTHGRTGLAAAALGSIADRVVRQASCPVLTVRARPDGDAAPPRPITRILYAADFSPTARAAWPWALALAEATGARIELLHVTALPVPDRHLSADMLGRMAQLLQEQGQAEAERFLQGWERAHPSPVPRERIDVVVGRGAPADEIVRWARMRSADLIVMGTHGGSGLLRWMLGSVAHHVVQTAACPVLTVGPASQAEERRHAN